MLMFCLCLCLCLCANENQPLSLVHTCAISITQSSDISISISTRKKEHVPRSKLKSCGDRAFSVCAPKLWNDIPEIIKFSVNLNTFKRNLS